MHNNSTRDHPARAKDYIKKNTMHEIMSKNIKNIGASKLGVDHWKFYFKIKNKQKRTKLMHCVKY